MRSHRGCGGGNERDRFSVASSQSESGPTVEFSYKISEAEYIQAAALRMKTPRVKSVKAATFWIFILVCLVLLWRVIEKNENHVRDETSAAQLETADSGTSDARVVEPSKTRAFGVNVAPFFVLIAVWLFLLFRFMPKRLKRSYRADPMMQGEFKVKITPDSFETANTSGSSSRTAWNNYQYWREGKSVIILVNFSGTYFILGLAALPEPQWTELRGILGAALPQK